MEQTTGDGDALGLTFAESTTPLAQFGVVTVGLTTNGDLAFRRFIKPRISLNSVVYTFFHINMVFCPYMYL